MSVYNLIHYTIENFPFRFLTRGSQKVVRM